MVQLDGFWANTSGSMGLRRAWRAAGWTSCMTRNEAESRYGFRLYQGGAVPGKDIRVVKTGDWDVEACAGTHLKNTGEVGFVKIVYTERVQDGVERLGYAVGLEGLKAVQHQELILWKG